MHRPTAFVLASALLAALSVLPAAAQVTFTVNTAADTPDVVTDGVCDADADAPGAQCTLRAAIQEAEATAAADSIHFDIPGAGVHTVAVVGADLPVLFQPATIDGYTQPGASPNTNGPAQGTNAAIRIEIVNGGGRLQGLVLCFGDKTVRGLAVGGFADHGVLIACNGTTGHVVEGCFIGTDASGTLARPNGFHGVQIASASANRIGGTVPAARNVLSGNGRFGVVVSSSGAGQPATGNLVQGNLIGTDASGTAAVPNGASGDGGGVGVGANQGSAAGNVVGGSAAGARNVISGNVGPGVLLSGLPSFAGVRVEGNAVGTDVTGALPLPNTGAGVLLDGPAGVAVGGSAPGAGNVIAHNGGAGVAVGRSAGNRVLGNALFANGGLGVDLGAVGPAPNDAGDADEGANRLQNTPALDRAALTDAGSLTVTYRVDTDPGHAAYPLRVEFFRADAGGQGEAFLGAGTYSATDHGGCGAPPCPKTATFAPAAPIGTAVVATATDDAGNTSEFTALPAVAAEPGPGSAGEAVLHAPAPNPAGGRATLRFTLLRPARVRLAVVDALGREVALLVDAERPAGLHEATLDAGRLAPGVYVAHLTAGVTVQARRLAVVR